MITYNTLKDGSLSGNGISSIPVGHRFYNQALAQVEAGEAEILPYVEPEPDIEQQRQAAMQTGVEFEGVMCSAFKEDQWGLASVKEFIMAGNDVDFWFRNGNTLTLTSTNLAAFEAVWIPFRQAHTKPNFTGS